MSLRTIGTIGLALVLIGLQADRAGTQELPPGSGDDWCWNCGDLHCLFGFGQGYVGCRDGGPNSGYCSTIPYKRCRFLMGQMSPSGIVTGEEVLAEAIDGTRRGGCGNWIVGIPRSSDQGPVPGSPPTIRI